MAGEIVPAMKAASHDVREINPLEQSIDVANAGRKTSPHVHRIRLEWESMREDAIEPLPKARPTANDIRRMERAGVAAEWADVLRDLNALTETVIALDGKRFALRSAAVGVAGRIARCDGVRLPKAVRRIEEGNAGTSA